MDTALPGAFAPGFIIRALQAAVSERTNQGLAQGSQTGAEFIAACLTTQPQSRKAMVRSGPWLRLCAALIPARRSEINLAALLCGESR
jgi:hypothetical protein